MPKCPKCSKPGHTHISCPIIGYEPDLTLLSIEKAILDEQQDISQQIKNLSKHLQALEAEKSKLYHKRKDLEDKFEPYTEKFLQDNHMILVLTAYYYSPYDPPKSGLYERYYTSDGVIFYTARGSLEKKLPVGFTRAEMLQKFPPSHHFKVGGSIAGSGFQAVLDAFDTSSDFTPFTISYAICGN